MATTLSIEEDGSVRYSAYSFGAPVEMNHNDDITWDGGALFEALSRATGRPLEFSALPL